jgi:hypothetical protein
MNGVYGVQGSQVTALDVWLVGSGGAFYKAGTPITNASMAADLVAISGVGDAAIPNKVSLVAVGPTTIATSVNGTPLVSWGTPAGQPRAVWVNTAANFVVVGDGGYAQFVGNGSATGNWAGTSETLNGVWGDPTFGIWAVGNKGVILTHPTP